MALAYCGLNCDECQIYLASINENTNEQLRLAKEYSTDTCKFTKEDMFCLGCHSEKVSEKMCGDCEIRECGTKRSCGNCAECDDFPCLILKKYLGENSDSLNNLKQLATEFRKTG